MKTLDEFNEEARKAHEEADKFNRPHANGIACPKCDKELWDSNPMLTLTSDPPQKNVHCPSCGYAGYRIV